MPNFPIAILIVLLTLLVLVLQNLSPSLPLVFLGIKSMALPLGVWVALAIAAGAITAWAIGVLFQLASPPRPANTRRRMTASPSPIDPEPEKQTWETQTAYASAAPPNYQPEAVLDAEVADPSPIQDRMGGRNRQEEADVEEWDNEEEWMSEESVEAPEDHGDDPVNRRNFEVKKEPISSFQEGSMYSYSYRDPESFGSGRRESIYEADETENPTIVTPPKPDRQAPIEPEIEEERQEPIEDDLAPPTPEKSQSPKEDDWTSDRKTDDGDW